MGAHLRCYGADPERWSEALDKLQNATRLALGQEQLFSRLRISYDARGPAEKGMFLDVAFFFLGRSADAAKRAWLGYANACICTLVLCAQARFRCCFLVYLFRVCDAAYMKHTCRCQAPIVMHLFPARRSKAGDVDCWLHEATPSTDLDTLVSCCLLSVDAEGRFAMHDQLRDLAYAIVRSEGRIAQPSRVRGRDATALLQEQVLMSACACSHTSSTWRG